MNGSGPIRSTGDEAVELDLQVVPRASRDRVVGLHGDRLKIQITAPPVDGEANAALRRFLARTLDVPRADVELVRGATGKRKTWRVRGLEAAEVARRLGLATLAALPLFSGACEPSQRPLGLEVVLPEDAADLEAADNLAFALDPDGLSGSLAVDGTEFELQLVLEPDLVPRTLSLYLADGEDLLAWGNSAPFFTAGEDVGMAMFLGRPGRLSTFPADLGSTPDPDLLAARALGRGMLVLDGDGDTFLLNEFDLQVESGARLDGAPAPDNGMLASAEDGTVLRVAWDEGLAVWRYEPASDTWIELALDDGAAPARPGAAALVRDDLSRVYLLGGGGRTDGVALATVPDAEGMLDLAPIDGLELDVPRDGATASWLPGDEAGVLLFGTGEPSVPVLYDTDRAQALGPDGPWLGGRCITLSEAPARTLCLGGVRDGAATADALLLDADGTATELVGLLPVPLEDPLVFGDEGAVYAQGEGIMVRLSRAVETPSAEDVETVEASALRARGGHSVALGTGASFLVGGTTTEGGAVDRWQVFQPALDGPD